MSLKTILYAGLAVASLSSPALVTAAHAGDDSYWCNDHRCYDDQADETRRLNRLQAEHPGLGIRAVPGYHGQDYDDGDDDDRDSNGYYDRNDDHQGYGDQDDDDDDQPTSNDDDDDDDDGGY